MQKGKTNNPYGRPKGKPNIITRELRKILKALIARELENLPKLIENLEKEKRLEIIIKLLPYVLPKVESVVDAGNEWTFEF